MMRSIALTLAIVLLSGCGTYRITYQFPSKQPVAETLAVRTKHSHGIGLLGGGAYFFALHQMFPALVDYTGERNISAVCPTGVYEITHYHDFGQNTVAALISWLVIVNAWHQSNEEWLCVQEAQQTQPVQTPPAADSASPAEAAPTPGAGGTP